MKTYILLFLSTMLLFTSCKEDDTQYETVIVAVPDLMAKAELRLSIAVEGPQALKEEGKIYVYQNYVFVNDKNEGVHVIDNSNPEAPSKIAFINIPGNRDIEVRNNLLYADSYSDLAVFSINDINNITYLYSYEDVFDEFRFAQAPITEPVDFISYDNYDPRESFIVGWTYREEVRKVQDNIYYLEDAASDAGGNTTGQGGSLARFKIVGSYLYAVDYSSIYTFNIEQQAVASEVGRQEIGWEIETIFNQDDYLYIGSASGMFIYSIENPAAPSYVSEINHLRGCDPVVVDGDYAYLTLRGGNVCGQNLSILEVIDVSNRSNPFIVQDYPMQEPYGLGFKGDLLFVSDGPYGLHIYNKSNPLALELVSVLQNINVLDIIPLEERLLAIADGVLYQYAYEDDGISEISSFEIN